MPCQTNRTLSFAAFLGALLLSHYSEAGGIECKWTLSQLPLLVERAARGDIAAFEEMRLQTKESVYKRAFKLLGRTDDAEDISQEVYLASFQNIKNYDPRTPYTRWLLRVTTLKCMNFYRKKYRQNEVSLDNPITLGTYEITNFVDHLKDPLPADPVLILFSKTFSEDLQAALSATSEIQMQALLLVYVDEHSYAEAARIAGITENQMRSRLYESRQALINKLHKAGFVH